VLRGESPVIRSDGNFIRDYFYVEDGAAAYMLLAEHLATHSELRGEAFNFSYGNQWTVLELAYHILARMGSDLQPELLNQVSNEIRNQTLSAAKSRQVLGWSPLFNMQDGLDKTIAWYKDFFA
jgi:CDP-glucose 4,6-dehydratase